jgi:uncharacterized protein (TIGR03435 family)
MRALSYGSVAALMSVAAFGQSTESRPRFEAADVRVAPQTINRFMRGGALHSTRYEMRNASMVDLISGAYGVDPDKVFGGPSWLEMDRFDVIAIAPAKTAPETLNLMLQSLLADRFKLVVHAESKPMPAYALKVGAHPQLKESDGSGDPGCKQSMQGLPVGPMDGPVNISSITLVLTCRATSIETLLQRIPIPRRQGEVSRQVVDQTGLKGTWNFDFKFQLGGGAAGDISQIADAIDKQLGLKLEAATLPTPVIEVQSANQKPTPNSPAEMKIFPPLPTEFDVAEINPSKPGSDSPPMAMARGGAVMVATKGGGRGGRGTPDRKSVV